MTTYESDVKIITKNQDEVFGLINDMTNLQKLQDVNIEGKEEVMEKLKDVQFDRDSVSFKIDGFGTLGFRVIERLPSERIMLQSENAPFKVAGMIQLKQSADNETKMKMTLNADIPFMIKMMVDGKIKEGINKAAETLAKVLSSYTEKTDI